MDADIPVELPAESTGLFLITGDIRIRRFDSGDRAALSAELATLIAEARVNMCDFDVVVIDGDRYYTTAGHAPRLVDPSGNMSPIFQPEPPTINTSGTIRWDDRPVVDYDEEADEDNEDVSEDSDPTD